MLWITSTGPSRSPTLGQVNVSAAAQVEPSLPLARLRLARHAVVLRRDADTLQVGVHPAIAVPVAYHDLLRGLAAATSESQLRAAASAGGLPDGSATQLVETLRAAGLLTDGPLEAGPPAPVLRLIGAGSLGRRTASVLASAGLASCYLADLPGVGPGPHARPAPLHAPDRLDSLARTLRRRHPELDVRRVRHWTKPDETPVDLTVVAADGPEVDRLITDTLTATDQPYLVLRSSGHEVSVGPLVVPGQSSCLRCADLARRDADPQWPWVLAQLTRVRLDPAPSLLAWAAAYAATQVLAFASSGGTPESLGHTVELSTSDHAVRLRPWPLHRECGCRWPGRTE